MKLTESSFIRAIDYRDNGECRVFFTNEKCYTYKDVSREDADALMSADSIGKAFAQFKKKYEGKEVQEIWTFVGNSIEDIPQGSRVEKNQFGHLRELRMPSLSERAS